MRYSTTRSSVDLAEARDDGIYEKNRWLESVPQNWDYGVDYGIGARLGNIKYLSIWEGCFILIFGRLGGGDMMCMENYSSS